MKSSTAGFLLYLATVQGGSLAAFLLLLLGVRVSPGWVAENLLRLLRIRFATFAGASQVLDNGNPVVYLCNHRSWGDFWTDAALLSGPSFIARALVAAAIPWSAAWGHFGGWLWLFERGKHHAEGVVAWTANFWLDRIRHYCHKGVVLYPEGTRSLLPSGGPLKLGAIAAAYQLGWPVQVVITSNKERVTSESEMMVHCGSLCVSSVSEAIYPRSFATSEAFIQFVQDAWRKTWKEAYGWNFQPRARAGLPGARMHSVTWDPRGSWQLQALRLVVLMALLFLWRRWRSTKACEAKQEEKP